jgi:excisionase family DNA binding protein
MTFQIYNTYQAAERLGVSVRRIQALITTGLLKADKIGRDWAIPQNEVERFKEQERQAGRPSKNISETIDRSFLTHPTEIYLRVVEIIKVLIEIEGLDKAYRAFSEAAWSYIEKEIMTGFTRKRGAHVCLYRLLGKNRCPNSFEHPCDSPNIPGQDHLSEWVLGGKTELIVSQPYHLSYEAIKQLVAFCEERGLRADISGNSWHFPGRTIKVDITVNKEPGIPITKD